MMCYKDRTWCSHSRLCSNITCDRNFTEEERENAIKWWMAISDNCGGKDFPLASADFKTEDCGYSQIDAARDENDVELTDA